MNSSGARIPKDFHSSTTTTNLPNIPFLKLFSYSNLAHVKKKKEKKMVPKSVPFKIAGACNNFVSAKW